MSLSGPDWVKLNQLLDDALDLAPEQRHQWMDSLPPEYESLRETLRSLLFRQAGPETSEVLRRAPALPETALASNDLVGPYRLIRQLGAGGMATVWLAERADGSLQRQIALKLPRTTLADRELAQRLNRERDILAALEHPNIARLYDAGADANGRPYMAIEYVDGVPLDVYAASKSLSINESLELFVQIADAVACAHARLIVHQDLKPSNVLVKQDGDVRLLDFGIAQLLSASAPNDEFLHRYRAFTPRYAAPEQFEGQPASVATDIYSLGVILYELLAGRSPYPASLQPDIVCLDIVPILDVVDSRQAAALRGDLDAIINKALQLRPRERYETVNQLAEDIDRYRRHLPIRARPDTATYRARKFFRRHGVVATLASALSITVVSGAGVALWQSGVAMHERDRAVRSLEEVSATNEFWNMLFTEAVNNEEAVTMPQLLDRSERMAEQAFADAPIRYAVAIESIASLYISHGMHSKAATLIEHALQRTEGVEGAHRTDWLNCKYAMAIAQLDRSQEADKLLAEVIDRSGDRPDLQQYCAHRRAIVARDNNDAAGALGYIQHAYFLSHAQPVRSEFEEAKLLSDMAYAYELNGDSKQAAVYYGRAWDLFTALGRDSSHVAITVLNNWGNLDISTGNPSAALDRYSRAIEIAQEHSPAGAAPTYLLVNRASALVPLARYDEALVDFAEILKRAEEEKNLRMVTMALSGRAEVYRRHGDLDQARRELDRLAQQIGNSKDLRGPARSRMLLVEGRMRQSLGHLEEARRYFDLAVADVVASGAKTGGFAQPYIDRSKVRLEQGDHAGALADIEQALSFATGARGGAEHSAIVGFAALTQGDVFKAMSRPKDAARAWRTAVTNLSPTVGKSHPEAVRAQRQLNELT
ncbi:serine/threonine-protein kinase [Steroidobacter sp.]|uniref:serine/threonine-protein kinase n=1 Tax=Steroidobacter sp. TaxID=1978227 RepID=UPI001A4358A7|nr:serine/threonine-protein kinase [Steroidobacter sp.]MBL8269012.1 protein kinase [Steroidobacter sp.]